MCAPCPLLVASECLVTFSFCRCGWFVSVASIFLSELLDVDFGEPLHSLVICGKTHPLEDELLKWHRVGETQPPVEAAETAVVQGPDEGEGEAVGASTGVAAAEAAVGEQVGGQDTPR